jgi:hypothetical protein
MSQQTQKTLKFNIKNMITGFFLLTLVNLFCPAFVDPKTDAGQIFYIFVAVMTAFMFPFLEVKDVDSEDQTPKS